MQCHFTFYYVQKNSPNPSVKTHKSNPEGKIYGIAARQFFSPYLKQFWLWQWRRDEERIWHCGIKWRSPRCVCFIWPICHHSQWFAANLSLRTLWDQVLGRIWCKYCQLFRWMCQWLCTDSRCHALSFDTTGQPGINCYKFPDNFTFRLLEESPQKIKLSLQFFYRQGQSRED